ncbi:hypothetical protein [Pseudaestuariivita sp.]|uniref:hypothetical protein n=1 Tax=Pseudaestuariivita sp. TaxID=2211669 RepID=UPI004059D73E
MKNELNSLRQNRGGSTAAKLPSSPSTAKIASITPKLVRLAGSIEVQLLGLVDRVQISPGSMKVCLSGAELASQLNIEATEIDPEALSFSRPFQLRKRGVETKLTLEEATNAIDQTLIQNIAKAQNWYAQLKDGTALAEIARAEKTSPSRIATLLPLAFLAPDLLRTVIEGAGPIAFTSEWLKTHSLPTDWTDQRELVAAL